MSDGRTDGPCKLELGATLYSRLLSPRTSSTCGRTTVYVIPATRIEDYELGSAPEGKPRLTQYFSIKRYIHMRFLSVTQHLTEIQLLANKIADELPAAAGTDGIASRLRSRKPQNSGSSGSGQVNPGELARPRSGALNSAASTEGETAQAH